MIGSGRDKIKTEQQFADSAKHCAAMDLDGLVVIGGDDSNTNAALLGEYFAQSSEAKKCKVLGAPKTIDGDLKLHPYIPVSFGFDTCTKIYSELISNLAMDGLSTQKYYYFIRLMGRSASHITLECALQTHPNVTLIGEEVQAKKQSLQQVVQYIADIVQKRSAIGKDFGVVLVPEGIVEFIPEIGTLIGEINDILASGVKGEDVAAKLTKESNALFGYLPKNIRSQLLLDRDAHGNVNVSKIETEKLLASLVSTELEKLRASNDYKGSFQPQSFFFGYEGRCGLPSNFDSRYCHAIGRTVIALCDAGYTGLIASIGNLLGPVEEWTVSGTPISGLLNMERRHGHSTPVIKKALTTLDGKPFAALAQNREKWAINDCYRCPGPVQYSGPGSDDVSITLRLEVEEFLAKNKC